MSDTQAKLREILGRHAGLMTGTAFRVQAEDTSRRRAAGDFEVDKIVSGEIVGEEQDGFFLVQESFAADTRHGHLTLGSALNADAGHIATSAKDEELTSFDPHKTVFIDT